MGYWKQLSIQRDEDGLGNQIADALGISYFDLAVLDYELHTNESEDGVIYSYYVEFRNGDSHPEILKKINGVKNNSVQLEDFEIDDSNDDYYDYQYEAITIGNDFYANFLSEIANLKKLNNLSVEDNGLESILKKQIYVSVVGTLEVFLSDAFINLTMGDKSYFKRFVQTHPDFKQRKFELREIFESYESIEDIAKKVMLDTIYHDIVKVREMYTSTFEIAFPELKEMIGIVSTRHDLVHRNGKTKDGAKVEIDMLIVEKVIQKASDFVNDIVLNLDLKGHYITKLIDSDDLTDL